MATPSPAQPDEEVSGKQKRAERQIAMIAAFVIDTLGEPPDLLRVAVVKVWADRFRVNVHAGTDVTMTRVVHSYFVTVDETGQVVASDPAIVKLY